MRTVTQKRICVVAEHCQLQNPTNSPERIWRKMNPCYGLENITNHVRRRIGTRTNATVVFMHRHSEAAMGRIPWRALGGSQFTVHSSHTHTGTRYPSLLSYLYGENIYKSRG